MSLPVPLTVRVGNGHVTREVSAVAFIKNAVGGVQSISLRLSRPLDTRSVSPLERVYIYDARTAAVIAEGRIADLGRSASTDGQGWDLVAFGPAQHASDRAFPYILVDRSIEPFRRSSFSVRNATTDVGEVSEDEGSLEVRAEEGKTISTNWVGSFVNYRLRRAGMRLAKFRVDRDSGVTDTDYRLQLRIGVGAGSTTTVQDEAANTAGGSYGATITTDFSAGTSYDTVELRAARQTSGTTGAQAHWFEFSAFAMRAVLKDTAGSDITAAATYSGNTVLAHEVINDLLGRVLEQYDGPGASIDTSAVYGIDQLAYPDGVTAEQVLEDVMALEPAYRWYCGPSTSSGKYSFFWEPWPTTVRYEVTLDDGGTFPVSTQELFNRVTVRYNLRNGQTKSLTATGACPILDDAGITRSTVIDASDEIGSANGAQRLADNFLAEHKQPANAGQLTIARPIRDLVTGRMVEPFEIEPGNLIRVRGVESYPDALNASSNDGLTVFRIWSMSYASDSAAAVLELDVPSRTTTNALKALAKRRNRKR